MVRMCLDYITKSECNKTKTELSVTEIVIVKLADNKGKLTRKDIKATLGISQTMSGWILKYLRYLSTR